MLRAFVIIVLYYEVTVNRFLKIGAREKRGWFILSVPQVHVLGFQKSESKNPPQRQSLNFHSQPVPLLPMLKDDQKKIEDPSRERIRVDFGQISAKINKQDRGMDG